MENQSEFEIDDIFSSFKEQLRDKQEKNSWADDDMERIRQHKHKVLIPVRKLLKRIQDLNLLVENSEPYQAIFSPEKNDKTPVLFEVFEDEASERWGPGKSIFIKHPAELEIAVPSTQKQTTDGVIYISCTGTHPDRDNFNKPFHSVEDACIVLSNFIIKHVVSKAST